MDKVWIGINAQSTIFNDEVGIEWLETKVQDAGLLGLSQLIRYHLFYVKHFSQFNREWCQNIIKNDILGRKIVQREVYIQEQIQALKKSLQMFSVSSTDPPELDINNERLRKLETWEKELSLYEKELRKLNDQYWIHQRNMWKLEVEMPYGPISRAFKNVKSNTEWHLLPWLREDCARRGGCCGRGCRCCENPRDTNRQFYNQGHCTTSCPCCIHANGLTDTSSLDDMKDFPIDLLSERWTRYTRRMTQAYIFGLDSINLRLL